MSWRKIRSILDVPPGAAVRPIRKKARPGSLNYTIVRSGAITLGTAVAVSTAAIHYEDPENGWEVETNTLDEEDLR